MIAFTVVMIIFLIIAASFLAGIVIPLLSEEFAGITALEALAGAGHAVPAVVGSGAVSVAAAIIAGRAADECGLL